MVVEGLIKSQEVLKIPPLQCLLDIYCGTANTHTVSMERGIKLFIGHIQVVNSIHGTKIEPFGKIDLCERVTDDTLSFGSEFIVCQQEPGIRELKGGSVISLTDEVCYGIVII